MKNEINKRIDTINGLQRIPEDKLIENVSKVDLFNSMDPDIALSQSVNPFQSQFKNNENNNRMS